MNQITLQNWNSGGIAPSKFMGREGSLAKMIGLDVHSVPGLLKANQKLTKESGSTVTEFVKYVIDSSDGSSYWFSSQSGKVWKRTSSGTWSLAYTTSPTNGTAYCLGACEHEGYIYWATENWLHRISVLSTSNWATGAAANWQDLSQDDGEIGSTGFTYTLLTSISEAAANRQTYLFARPIINAIAVYVDAVGAGNWTLTVHDSNNVSVASKTILNASMATGWVKFTFAANFQPSINEVYHIHVTVSAGTSRVVTGVASDLESARMIAYGVSDTEYHPMIVQNGILFVANGSMVNQVENGLFSYNALDIPYPHRIRTLGKLDTDLLIGTLINTSKNIATVFRWNTWSISWTSDCSVDEIGVNAFIPVGNNLIIQAGINGGLYSYDGMKMQLMEQLPGTYSPTQYGQVHPSAVTLFRNVSMFGFSNSTGNPTECGVYSFGSKNPNLFPRILNLEYLISQNVDESVEVGAMIVMGNSLYVSWKNGSAYGVDEIDYDNKVVDPYFESRVISGNKDVENTFSKFVVGYASLPQYTSIELYYWGFLDGVTEGWVTIPLADDPIKHCLIGDFSVAKSDLELRLILKTVNNLTPEVIQLIVYAQ